MCTYTCTCIVSILLRVVCFQDHRGGDNDFVPGTTKTDEVDVVCDCLSATQIVGTNGKG